MSPIPLKKQIYSLLVVVFLCSFIGKAQSVTFKIPDSLKSKSYEEIFKSYEKVYQDTLKSKIYLNTYYKKAILDNDDYKKSVALSHISYYLEDYATIVEVLDLAIHYAKNAKNDENLMIVYSFAGGFYSLNLSYDKGLDFYFKSLAIAEKINDQYYKYVNKHNIALIKGDIGNFKESLEIFKECYVREVQFGEEGYLYDYVLSGLSLSEAFIRNKQTDSASYYLNKVYNKAKIYFQENEQEYLEYSIYKDIANTKNKVDNYNNLSASLLKINEQGDDTKRISLFGNYYAGMIGKDLRIRHSYKHFEQVDSIYTKANVIIPEVRLSFQELIKYYKKKSAPQKQLLYVDKLLKFDSIHGKQFKVLTSKINENYDTPLLLAEKESLILQLNKKNTTLSYGSILLFTAVLLLIVLAVYLYIRTRNLKEKFHKIVNKPIVTESIASEQLPSVEKPVKKELSISSTIVDQVLENLIKFENNKQFINKNLTSASLAKKVGTNSKYLSQIINYSKNKNITSYVNDLRIEYSIELLKSDSKMLNYTIQSIAEEVGFNNAESFSKAFFKKTDLKPSYFIKQLKTNKLR